MSAAARPDRQRPDFVWIARPGRLARLLMASGARRAEMEGRSLRFLVYPQGINWIDGYEQVSARWTDLYLWQEITRRYYNGIYTGTVYRYTVQVAGGPTKVIRDRLSPAQARASEAVRLAPRPAAVTAITVEQLGRLIAAGVTRAGLPWALERMNAGGPVPFGPLTVSRDGIAAGDQFLPWPEIQEVRTRDGQVCVRRGGKWLPWKSTPVSKIPNYALFEALVLSILGRRPATASY